MSWRRKVLFSSGYATILAVRTTTPHGRAIVQTSVNVLLGCCALVVFLGLIDSVSGLHEAGSSGYYQLVVMPIYPAGFANSATFRLAKRPNGHRQSQQLFADGQIIRFYRAVSKLIQALVQSSHHWSLGEQRACPASSLSGENGRC